MLFLGEDTVEMKSKINCVKLKEGKCQTQLRAAESS